MVSKKTSWLSVFAVSATRKRRTANFVLLEIYIYIYIYICRYDVHYGDNTSCWPNRAICKFEERNITPVSKYLQNTHTNVSNADHKLVNIHRIHINQHAPIQACIKYSKETQLQNYSFGIKVFFRCVQDNMKI